jgi:hypothetical protein
VSFVPGVASVSETRDEEKEKTERASTNRQSRYVKANPSKILKKQLTK